MTNLFTQNSSENETTVRSAVQRAIENNQAFVSSYEGMLLLAREAINQQEQRFLKPGWKISVGIGAHQIISLVDFEELNVQSWVILKIQQFSGGFLCLIKASYSLCKEENENIFSW